MNRCPSSATRAEMENRFIANHDCVAHCSVCGGLDHHWLPESDDEINEGEPFMVCKHCSATRPMADDEDLD